MVRSLGRASLLVAFYALTSGPMGSHLLDTSRLVPRPATGIRVVPLRLEANAWFNLYRFDTNLLQGCPRYDRQGLRGLTIP